MIYRISLKNLVDTFRLSVGYKYLSKTIITYQLYQLSYTIIVEFVEDIIKKQNWLVSLHLMSIFKLRKFDGYNE
ncbi:hypothetical protein DSECCO2_543470 [anaerobic digester metagenome]